MRWVVVIGLGLVLGVGVVVSYWWGVGVYVNTDRYSHGVIVSRGTVMVTVGSGNGSGPAVYVGRRDLPEGVSGVMAWGVRRWSGAMWRWWVWFPGVVPVMLGVGGGWWWCRRGRRERVGRAFPVEVNG